MKKIHASEPLIGHNATDVADLDSSDIDLVAKPLLQLLAEAMDEATEDGQTWISLGLTRKRDAIVLTVHSGDDTIAVYGPNLLAVLADVPSLL